MILTPARYGQPLADSALVCQLCPHACYLRPGQSGRCSVRHNQAGEFVTSAYGYPILTGVEPIEKKYIFHFYPGASTYSLGSAGCNLGCKYCINWRVSQGDTPDGLKYISPEEVVKQALLAGAKIIAFTFTEVTIFIEYAADIARLAKEAGLKIVAKSNGFMMPAAWEELSGCLDAINVDLKGLDNTQFAKIMGASAAPIFELLPYIKRSNVWLEVSTLVTPTLNSDAKSAQFLASYIAQELGQDTPWHLLRFFPHYLMDDVQVTSQAELEEYVGAGKNNGLNYIYNRELKNGEQMKTICPHCESTVIQRKGYLETAVILKGNNCLKCGQSIAGRFNG